MALATLFAGPLDPLALSAFPEAALLSCRDLGGELAAFATPALPTILIGYLQSVADLDREACARGGIAVGRRFVSGDPFLLGAGDLLFSLVTSKGEAWPHRKAVEEALASISTSLSSLGPRPKVRLASVLVEERRVATATAMRKARAHLVCGYVTLRGPVGAFAPVLMMPAKQLSANYAAVEDHAKRAVEPRAFAASMASAWAARLGEEEVEEVPPDRLGLDSLTAEKYANARWVTMR